MRSGPDSSVVVLQNFATLHNLNAVYPPDNDLTYVIVGPGAYLNFPNLKAHGDTFYPLLASSLRVSARSAQPTSPTTLKPSERAYASPAVSPCQEE